MSPSQISHPQVKAEYGVYLMYRYNELKYHLVRMQLDDVQAGGD